MRVARCDREAWQRMQQGNDGEQQGSNANQQIKNKKSNNAKRKNNKKTLIRTKMHNEHET